MKDDKKSIVGLMIFLVAIIGCTDPFSDDEPDIQRMDGKTFIVDQTGKRWDITHAISQYGFEAEQFQFGLGPFAIQPIQDPEFLRPGDKGYPPQQNSFLVIGVALEGNIRAYPIDVLSRHEIVDEVLGSQHVAVAY